MLLEFLLDGISGSYLGSSSSVAGSHSESKHERLDAAGRRRMQNFTMLPRYLPAGLWDVLRAGQAPNAGSLASTQALEALKDFSMRLGLQNPSEPTFATFFLSILEDETILIK